MFARRDTNDKHLHGYVDPVERRVVDPDLFQAGAKATRVLESHRRKSLYNRAGMKLIPAVALLLLSSGCSSDFSQRFTHVDVQGPPPFVFFDQKTKQMCWAGSGGSLGMDVSVTVKVRDDYVPNHNTALQEFEVSAGIQTGPRSQGTMRCLNDILIAVQDLSVSGLDLSGVPKVFPKVR